ncbi:TPR and ankyrin repeat-containing protein 1-like [Canna indica]|uniref:TPR and ankyrin repeat-containing protein 1-like n=1 Tax=Canna indica TaxID=4628 RepID=A0AAQ3KBI7_9LILI|nr:TPR and ankyrin repeat-containing protein 1-like [Canna indica]
MDPLRILVIDEAAQLVEMNANCLIMLKASFYKKQIRNGPNVKEVNYNKNYEDLLFGSYAFLNVADGREVLDDKGNNRRNMVDVAVVLHLVQRHFKHWETSSQSLSIWIISPYSSQVNAINNRLGNKYTSCHGFDVRVKSIDGFEGEENDVIIPSTVRANNKG